MVDGKACRAGFGNFLRQHGGAGQGCGVSQGVWSDDFAGGGAQYRKTGSADNLLHRWETGIAGKAGGDYESKQTKKRHGTGFCYACADIDLRLPHQLWEGRESIGVHAGYSSKPRYPDRRTAQAD